jgi:hypothetical protein
MLAAGQYESLLSGLMGCSDADNPEWWPAGSPVIDAMKPYASECRLLIVDFYTRVGAYDLADEQLKKLLEGHTNNARLRLKQARIVIDRDRSADPGPLGQYVNDIVNMNRGSGTSERLAELVRLVVDSGHTTTAYKIFGSFIDEFSESPSMKVAHALLQLASPMPYRGDALDVALSYEPNDPDLNRYVAMGAHVAGGTDRLRVQAFIKSYLTLPPAKLEELVALDWAKLSSLSPEEAVRAAQVEN